MFDPYNYYRNFICEIKHVAGQVMSPLMGILKMYHEHFSELNVALWLHDHDFAKYLERSYMNVTQNKWQFLPSLLLIPVIGMCLALPGILNTASAQSKITPWQGHPYIGGGHFYLLFKWSWLEKAINVVEIRQITLSVLASSCAQNEMCYL